MPTNVQGRKQIILTDDPLLTGDTRFLEEILKAAEGYKYLEAVQEAPTWKNVGIATDDASKPLNEQLPGGNIVRQRYLVADIQRHYEELRK